LALLSAICSSADSCLVTAATVGCYDLLHSSNTRTCRASVLLLGACGLLLAERGHGILKLLLMANDIYVCGVVAPIFCGLMLPGRVHPVYAILAIAFGGAFGLFSALTENSLVSLIGIIVSALCVLAGILFPLRTPLPRSD
ncbi:MAG: hypothetical protein IKX79_00750, partial [Desulfovibrionaceae bacterium]|nr:hypothetical protein [Desulfovibrionaceae bacterium]